MQIRFLIVSGPQKPPAELNFGPGLNVIFGGSNTGKSYVLRLIDYMLGAQSPPEPISEQAGYDLVSLGVVLDDKSEKTFVRALQGGDIKVLDGLIRHRPASTDGTSFSAKHSAKNSLSKILLEQIGASNSRIRIDASGKTRDLSFRDLSKHILIDEAKIQNSLSPILTGQFISKTAETSIFKYVLTGVDDSALDLAKPDAHQPLRQAAQLELLDKQIRNIESEIAEKVHDADELIGLDSALSEQINRRFEVQEATEYTYRKMTSQRSSLRKTHQETLDRIAEIESLQARFDLLAKHYKIDQKKLESLEEAGVFFMMEASNVCPVCGAEPDNHRPEFACDGDVEEIVSAATAERAELDNRINELGQLTSALVSERELLIVHAETVQAQLELLQSGIVQEVPAVQLVRFATNELIRKKIDLQKDLGLIQRRDSLKAQRADLGISPGYDSSTIVAQQQLDGASLDRFSQVIEKELQAWEFPEAQRVFFEVQKMDISVSGKSRKANGKGVRALLHGAFSVAFMKYARSLNHPHPGFLAVDSLFITYRDPADDNDATIAKTPLRDRAFSSFAELSDELQLIVLENVDVPSWLETDKQCIKFTGQPGVGRAGFYPK